MRAQETTDQAYPLRSIYFYPTESCNLRCIHCWVRPHYAPDAAAYQSQNGANVTVEAMEKVIRQALPLGLQHIKFTGGEPLLSPLFFDYLASFSKYDLSFSIETNATLVDDAVARKLAAFPLRHISTSLDGSTPENHDRIRRVAGSFKRTLTGIRALIDNGYVPQVIFCLQRANASDLEETIRLALDLEIRSFEINPVMLSGSDGSVPAECRGLPIETLLQLEREIEAEYPARFPGMHVNLYLPPALKGIRLLAESSLYCCRVHNICGILSNGDVSLCGIGRRKKNLVMGNVSETTIAEIWRNGRLFRDIRRQVPRKLEGVCGRCLFRHHCFGFCRADALFEGRSLLAPNDFCQSAYQKGLFPGSRIWQASDSMGQ
jgi:SynChlorMet cassette radical SAM/SPASM protein ScmF